MIKTLFTVILILIYSLAHGQCKKGFSKSKLNGKKVKIACINYSEADGLSLEITNNERSSDSVLIDIVFTNPNDSTKSIYWHNFVNSSNIPLSFTISVFDKNGVMISNKFHPRTYMDSHVYYGYDQVNKKIEIESKSSFKRTARVWWPGISDGDYKIILYYGYGISDNELESNELNIKIKTLANNK